MSPRLPRYREEKHLAEKLKTPEALEQYEKLLIGANIKTLRRRAKMKQAALAKKLKTSQSAVARMEAGKQNFSIRTLIQIGWTLGKKLTVKFH